MRVRIFIFPAYSHLGRATAKSIALSVCGLCPPCVPLSFFFSSFAPWWAKKSQQSDEREARHAPRLLVLSRARSDGHRGCAAQRTLPRRHHARSVSQPPVSRRLRLQSALVRIVRQNTEVRLTQILRGLKIETPSISPKVYDPRMEVGAHSSVPEGWGGFRPISA